MFQLECCGIDGPNDWAPKLRPLTCCHKPETRDNAAPPESYHCIDANPGDEILYSDGCLDRLKTKANANAKILIGVGIGVAFVEVIIFF